MPEDEDDNRRIQQHCLRRNLIAFWILGLCNNFAYVVMLSAAKDILGEAGGSNNTDDSGKCIVDADDIKCSKISTGAILLADIIPSLVVKLLCPFLLHSVSYSVRHVFVLLFQCSSFLLVAFSNDIFFSILGVVFASAGSGLGEVSYLALASYFPGDVVLSWSSGTGGAGIMGSLAFAVMTDHRLLGLSPRSSILLMLIVPLILFYTFWKVLVFPTTVRTVDFLRVSTYLIPREQENRNSLARSQSDESLTIELPEDVETPLLAASSSHYYISEQADSIVDVNFSEKIKTYFFLRLRMIRPLLKYMIPLCIVYYAEYFINQGLLELLTFTCSTGFGLSPASQYRWYQVLYQIGVFVSRSSVKILPLNPLLLPVLSILQVINAVLLFNRTMHPVTGHIMLIFVVVFYEGLLGGASYANTFNTLHRTIQFHREFSMSFVALSDALGIVLAGFTGIWAHNYVCSKFALYFSTF